jgi:ethanolamine utilization microcompartment shell protein EutL
VTPPGRRDALRRLATLDRELRKLDHVPRAQAARADELAAAHAHLPAATHLLIALDGGDVATVRAALDALAAEIDGAADAAG